MTTKSRMDITNKERKLNKLPENKLIIGCNYHTKWQSDKRMRFILKKINGDKALLATRITKKEFWTNVSDLIFIETNYNIEKAIELSK